MLMLMFCRVTHASPAGGYAHVINRAMESDAEVLRLKKDPKECTDIAQQLIFNSPGKNLNVRRTDVCPYHNMIMSSIIDELFIIKLKFCRFWSSSGSASC